MNMNNPAIRYNSVQCHSQAQTHQPGCVRNGIRCKYLSQNNSVNPPPDLLWQLLHRKRLMKKREVYFKLFMVAMLQMLYQVVRQFSQTMMFIVMTIPTEKVEWQRRQLILIFKVHRSARSVWNFTPGMASSCSSSVKQGFSTNTI